MPDETKDMFKRGELRTNELYDPFMASIRFSFLGCAYEIARTNYQWTKHLHDQHELIFVQSGEIPCHLNGRQITLKAGQCLIVCPGDVHEDSCSPDVKEYIIWFRLHPIISNGGIHQLKMLRNATAPSEQRISIKDQKLWETLEQMVSDGETDEAFADIIQSNLAEQMVWRILRQLPAELINPWLIRDSHQNWLRLRLQQVFEQSLSKPINVAAMAAELNMSESSLAHCCRADLGVSPALAFRQYRAQAACRMLQHTNRTVAEIAASLGFSEPGNFIHFFKSTVGCTPGQYQKQHQKMASH